MGFISICHGFEGNFWVLSQTRSKYDFIKFWFPIFSRKVMRKPKHPTRKSTNFPKNGGFSLISSCFPSCFSRVSQFPQFFYSFPSFFCVFPRGPSFRPWESSRIWAIRGARRVPRTSWPRRVFFRSRRWPHHPPDLWKTKLINSCPENNLKTVSETILKA